MTGPGEGAHGAHEDPRIPEQPAWYPPGEPPPAPFAADYPATYPGPYPPPYQPSYPPFGPQFGPPGPYYPPLTPGYPAPPVGTNGLAIASLITAFVGFLCCVGSIVAIVLGIVALNQIKQTRQEGRGLAIAGISIGVAGLAMILIVWIFAAALHS